MVLNVASKLFVFKVLIIRLQDRQNTGLRAKIVQTLNLGRAGDLSQASRAGYLLGPSEAFLSGSFERKTADRTGHLATGYWLLITDYWLLATDYWLLTTGYLVSDLSKNVPPRRQTGVGTRRGGPYSSVGPWRGLSRLRRYRVGNCTFVTIQGQGNLLGTVRLGLTTWVNERTLKWCQGNFAYSALACL